MTKPNPKPDVGHCDLHGRSELFYAVLDDRPHRVRTLLENGADPNRWDHYGLSPATAAVALDLHGPLLEFLSRGWDPNSQPAKHRPRDASPALGHALLRVFETGDRSALNEVLHPHTHPGSADDLRKRGRPLSFAPISIAALTGAYVSQLFLLNEPRTNSRPMDDCPLEPALAAARSRGRLRPLELYLSRDPVAGDSDLVVDCLRAELAHGLGALGLAEQGFEGLAALADSSFDMSVARRGLEAASARSLEIHHLRSLERLVSCCALLGHGIIAPEGDCTRRGERLAQRLFRRATTNVDGPTAAAARLANFTLKEVVNLARMVPTLALHHVLVGALAQRPNIRDRLRPRDPKDLAGRIAPLVGLGLFDRDELPPWSVLELMRRLSRSAEQHFNQVSQKAEYVPSRSVRSGGTWQSRIASTWRSSAPDLKKLSAQPIMSGAEFRRVGSLLQNCLLYRDDLIDDCREGSKAIFAVHGSDGALLSVFLLELERYGSRDEAWVPVPGIGVARVFKQEAMQNRRVHLVDEAAAKIPEALLDALARGKIELSPRTRSEITRPRRSWQRWAEAMGNEPWPDGGRQAERAFRVLTHSDYTVSGAHGPTPLIRVSRSSVRWRRSFKQWIARPLEAYGGRPLQALIDGEIDAFLDEPPPDSRRPAPDRPARSSVASEDRPTLLSS